MMDARWAWRVRMTELIYLNLIETDWLGLVGVAVSALGLRRLRMDVGGKEQFLLDNQSYREGEYTFSASGTEPFTSQIRNYLQGELQIFTLPIDWSIYTPFQKAVLQETLRIPYGETRSYGEVARAVGKPGAARAVGQAEKRNQVPLVVPCHRVIGADGSMTGYGGRSNTDLKARLIAFEVNTAAGKRP